MHRTKTTLSYIFFVGRDNEWLNMSNESKRLFLNKPQLDPSLTHRFGLRHVGDDAVGDDEEDEVLRPERVFNSPISDLNLSLGILNFKLKSKSRLKWDGLSFLIWNPFETPQHWRLKCKFRQNITFFTERSTVAANGNTETQIETRELNTSPSTKPRAMLATWLTVGAKFVGPYSWIRWMHVRYAPSTPEIAWHGNGPLDLRRKRGRWTLLS